MLFFILNLASKEQFSLIFRTDQAYQFKFWRWGMMVKEEQVRPGERPLQRCLRIQAGLWRRRQIGRSIWW